MASSISRRGDNSVVKFSLRCKLILWICLPLLAVYLAVLALDYRTNKARAVEVMQRHLVELTAHHAAEIAQDLTVAAQAARSAADTLTQFSPKDPQQLDQLLRSVVKTHDTVFGACIAYEPKVFASDRQRFAPYVCRAPKGDGLKRIDLDYDYPRWDWYLLPKLLGQPAWTDPYFDEGGGQVLMCTYAAPFFQDGRFAGVATVDIPLEPMQARLANVDTHGGYCTIVSGTGTFVSHPHPDYIMAESIFSLAMGHQQPELDAAGRDMLAGKAGVHRIIQVSTGKPAWIVFAPVESVGWSLAAVIPEEAVMADAYLYLNRQAGMFLFGLGLILGTILVASTWLVRPIARLAVVAGEVARGNLDVQVTGVRSRDEIGCFADTFNHMVTELKGNVEARIQETAARKAIERELQIARQIQVSLLPTARPAFPDRHEFTLDALNEAAKIMAGDFFDFWFVDEDRMALIMADVSGKGVPAAMFMAVSRTVLRDCTTPGRSPAEVMTHANRVLCGHNDEGMFVTVFYGHYHVRTGELVYTNAGHNPPFVVRAAGGVEPLGPPDGPIVGFAPDAEYGQSRLVLEPDDMLLVYTDGATEATRQDGAMLGEAGLREILAEIRTLPVEEVCRTVLRKVDAYRESPDQDDVTLLALRRQRA